MTEIINDEKLDGRDCLVRKRALQLLEEWLIELDNETNSSKQENRSQ